jgi:dTDP-4-amino-4,6-dideoxygalactose transaminase
VQDWSEPVWHLFVVRTNNRDKLQNALTESGIGTLIHYPVPIWQQTACPGISQALQNLKIATIIPGEILSLPIWPGMPEETVVKVIKSLRSFYYIEEKK